MAQYNRLFSDNQIFIVDIRSGPSSVVRPTMLSLSTIPESVHIIKLHHEHLN
jgi:hypothetical protein